MRIVADENIPYVREAFGALGEVTTLKGRSLSAKDVSSAEVLLVRSVTRVDERLLGGSNVRFVGTATIGFDHVDTDYLNRRGIPFVTAAGSNANSVAEYVLAALLTVGERRNIAWTGKTIGVVGVGNIGRLVARDAAAMGMRVLQNDPPRQRVEGSAGFVDLDTICRESDVITCHVPLNKQGPDRTLHLFDRQRLTGLRPETVLINSSRGAVVDNTVLLERLNGGKLQACVLDVWEPEPAINPELLRKVDLGSPHIAGYSFDGKVAGTQILFDAVRQTFNLQAEWDPQSCMPATEIPTIEIDAKGQGDQTVMRRVVRMLYDIEADDARLRKLIALPSDQQPTYFDQLRKDYPVRREFHNTRIVLQGASATLAHALKTWGFRIET